MHSFSGLYSLKKEIIYTQAFFMLNEACIYSVSSMCIAFVGDEKRNVSSLKMDVSYTSRHSCICIY